MILSIEQVIAHLSHYLPPGIYDICKRYLLLYPRISEIRLRKDKPIAFSMGEDNICTEYICDAQNFQNCLSLMCNGANYKQRDNMLKGVITLDHGFRAGLTGCLLMTDGIPKDLYSMSSINLRIPHSSPSFSDQLLDHLLSLPPTLRSTIIFSPPCGGKTTLLRELALDLSTPPVSKRVCVVDTCHEFSMLSEHTESMADVLSGYPLCSGIETAIRYLNPQYIICDEIGTQNDTDTIKKASFSGVTFIASTHASSIQELTQRPTLAELLRSGAFYSVVEISRNSDRYETIIRSVKELLV